MTCVIDVDVALGRKRLQLCIGALHAGQLGAAHDVTLVSTLRLAKGFEVSRSSGGESRSPELRSSWPEKQCSPIRLGICSCMYELADHVVFHWMLVSQDIVTNCEARGRSSETEAAKSGRGARTSGSRFFFSPLTRKGQDVLARGGLAGRARTPATDHSLDSLERLLTSAAAST